MDVDIARWILEFFLRQPWLDERTVSSLIRVLPLEDNNPVLKKGILLKKIESEISNDTVSEQILDLLEQIEELEYREGIEVLDSMKKAYCAVAVGCTVGVLRRAEEGDREGRYFEVVKRIWRGRVGEMERFQDGGVSVGLVSEGLRSWRDEMEAGVWDLTAYENVLTRSRGVKAVEAVRRYVDEARKKMGPSFLELVAETLGDSTVWEALGWEKAAARQDLAAENGRTETHKGNVLHRRKHIAMKRPRGSMSSSRGVKIADTDGLVPETSRDRYRCIPTPEANRVQEALESSSLELRAVVKDPLPDALRLAESVISDMARENSVHEPAVGSHNRVDVGAPSSSIDRSADAVLANGRDLGDGCCRDQNNGPKPSLMARNHTARIVEWDDSFDCSAEASARGPRLPSPNKRAVSPLKKYEVTKVSKRRKNKRWSTLEEDTLRTGVQKYGKGNWKLILSMYPDIFEERTEVDLKDKWRNLTR